MEQETLKTQVIKDIKSILPHLSDDTVEDVASNLLQNGLENMEDLGLTVQEDLEQLRPFDRRKLLRHWQNKGQTTATQQQAQPIPANLQQQESRRDIAPRYTIPWNKLPKAFEVQCQKGQQPEKKIMETLTNILWDNIQDKFPQGVERSFMTRVAEQIGDRYPESFSVHVGSQKLKGYPNLKRRFETKWDNEMRSVKRQKKDKVSTERRSFGCINWAPNIVENTETEGKVEEMKEMFNNVHKKEWDWTKIEALIKETYPLQRRDINKQTEVQEKRKKSKNQKRQNSRGRKAGSRNKNSDNTHEEEELQSDDNLKDGVMTTHEIKDKWPFIFTSKGMGLHFFLLTGVKFEDGIASYMEDNGKRLVTFMAQRGSPENIKIEKRMQKAVEKNKYSHPHLRALLLMLLDYLGEDQNSIMLKVEEHVKMEDVSEKVELPSTPCLVRAGSKMFKTKRFFFSIDGKVVAATPSFLDALCLMFCSYYVMNINYCEGATNTLEFFQRYVLNMNPERGSKSALVAGQQRATQRIPAKLLTLNEKFEAFKNASDNVGESDED